MIDILKRIFIGVAIGMSIFFIKSYCFALSIQFEPGDPVKIFNSSKHFQVAPLGNEQTIAYSLDIPYSNTDYDFVMFQLSEIITDEYGFSNTSATTRIYDVLRYNYYMWVFYSDNSATNCLYQDGVFLCPLSKNKTMNKIQFRFPPFNSSVSITGTLDIYFTAYCTPLKNTFNSLASSSNETLNETKKITDETDRSGNGDSFDNSGISSNSSKEEDLTSDSEDLFDNFDVDLSGNSSSFQYIFSILTRFIQANAKIFGVVLSILSFGFIKLVLGR